MTPVVPFIPKPAMMKQLAFNLTQTTISSLNTQFHHYSTTPTSHHQSSHPESLYWVHSNLGSYQDEYLNHQYN